MFARQFSLVLWCLHVERNRILSCRTQCGWTLACFVKKADGYGGGLAYVLHGGPWQGGTTGGIPYTGMTNGVGISPRPCFEEYLTLPCGRKRNMLQGTIMLSHIGRAVMPHRRCGHAAGRVVALGAVTAKPSQFWGEFWEFWFLISKIFGFITLLKAVSLNSGRVFSPKL